MAVIDIHISAEGVEDYFNTLRGLLRGDEKVTDLKVRSALVPVEVKPVHEGRPVETDPKGEEIDTSADAADTPGVETDLDAHGHPWSAALHASTKTQTKDGLWRMKPGVERPAPVPGYPKAEVAVEVEPEPVAAPVVGPDQEIWSDVASDFVETNIPDDTDEFASFAAEAPAREWSDADLSKLCNQAATKLGSPDEIKKLIAVYVSAGAVPHSRNIPVEDRERFAQEVEALAGITYEG